jgi:hypothetical protein
VTRSTASTEERRTPGTSAPARRTLAYAGRSERSCLRSRKSNALEGDRLGEAIEVGIPVEHREPAVLGGGCGDQCVCQRYAMVAVAAPGKLPQRAHRRIGHFSRSQEQPGRATSQTVAPPRLQRVTPSTWRPARKRCRTAKPHVHSPRFPSMRFLRSPHTLPLPDLRG